MVTHPIVVIYAHQFHHDSPIQMSFITFLLTDITINNQLKMNTKLLN